MGTAAQESGSYFLPRSLSGGRNYQSRSSSEADGYGTQTASLWTLVAPAELIENTLFCLPRDQVSVDFPLWDHGSKGSDGFRNQVDSVLAIPQPLQKDIRLQVWTMDSLKSGIRDGC